MAAIENPKSKIQNGQNGIASVEDFRKCAEAEAWQAPVRLQLPKSGLAVLARRPKPLAYLLVPHPLPDSVTTKAGIAGSAEGLVLTAEERAAQVRASSEVLCAAIIAPNFAVDPGPEAVDPRWLPAEDQEFLWRWIGGEVAADGRSLVPFREESRSFSGGSGGADVPLPPERIVEVSD